MRRLFRRRRGAVPAACPETGNLSGAAAAGVADDRLPALVAGDALPESPAGEQAAGPRVVLVFADGSSVLLDPQTLAGSALVALAGAIRRGPVPGPRRPEHAGGALRELSRAGH